MRISDACCAEPSPVRSTASTCSSLEEAVRQSLFSSEPFTQPPTRTSRETRAEASRSGLSKFPRLLWRCNLSAINLLSRHNSSEEVRPSESRNSARRSTYNALLPTSPLSVQARRQRYKSREQPTSPQTPGPAQQQGREQALSLFREEAEYSDYLSARMTGKHAERREDGVVFYELEVLLSRQRWRVAHRFSEFRALRQQLIKTFTRSKRRRQPRCAICENILASILETGFPSRHQWGSHLFSNSNSSSSSPSLGSSSHEDDMIAERKTRFQEFVAMCLSTVRSLRQHICVVSNSAACEITVALKLIEEFLGLGYTRYLTFLSERGVDRVTETSENLQQPMHQRRHENHANSDASAICRTH